MFNIASISNQFRLSYLIFTILLCGTFVSIFYLAETKVEQALIESSLLQQLPQSIERDGEQPVYYTDSGIKIYKFESAPADLKSQATKNINQVEVFDDSNDAELYFFKTNYNGQNYILSYLESGDLNASDYPVLTLFEEVEAIIYEALFGAVLLSLLIALLFSHLSSKAIIKPILDLKEAVESDQQNLDKLTYLPSQVGVLARAIEDRNKKLAQYLKREQLFTGDVSHELRTPLTIIMGAAEVLSAQLEPNTKAHIFAERIYKTALDTSEVVSALLMLSRAPEQLDTPATSINTVVSELVDRLDYLISHKPVTCHIYAEQDYIAYVRPELLKMALGNLIKNAFQYTENGDVNVIIDRDKIIVRDTGSGIPENMVPHMYERFKRMETYQENTEGMGLGLSIVQRIMKHLCWRLDYSTNKNGGSRFSIYYHPQRVTS